MSDLLKKVKATNKMSEKELMEWLGAVNEMLAWYISGEGDTNPCPFCKVAYCRAVLDNSCASCIWVLFEGLKCIDYFRLTFETPDDASMSVRFMLAKANREDYLVEKRVPMLQGWKKLLEVALKRRLAPKKEAV